MADVYSLGDPIVALATPYGQSALCLLRLSGDGICQKIQKFFSRPQGLSQSHRAVYGVFHDTDHRQIDEVIMTCFYAPRSFTGEDVVEICCHGNMRLVQQILQVLFSNGFRLAQRGEFSYRATLLGKMDLVKAEAIHELITAKSQSGIEQAFRHLQGQLSDELRKVYDELTTVGSYLRMHLDYPEDEVEPLPYFALDQSRSILNSLIVNSRNLDMWKDGAYVVIVGAPNVGKSSLFNLLVEQDRAIVSPTAGTTRDYLEADIELAGFPIRLIDTAGLRETTDDIEQLGIQKSFQLMQKANLILHVVEAGCDPSDENLKPYQEKILALANKTDLTPAGNEQIGISVTKKEGIDTLIDTIIARLDFGQIHEDQQLLMLGSMRQKELCQKALDHLESFGRQQKSGDLDSMYFDITHAMQAIGEILGTHVHQDLISAMFSQFCLGK